MPRETTPERNTVVGGVSSGIVVLDALDEESARNAACVALASGALRLERVPRRLGRTPVRAPASPLGARPPGSWAPRHRVLLP